MSPAPDPPFAELFCHTNFSFLTGASHPEEMIDRAISLGYTALAVTDECSLAGIVRAWSALQAHPAGSLQLLIGTFLRLEDGPSLVLLATDRQAYGQLSSLITRGRRAADKGDYRLTRADLETGLPGCLALLVPPDALPPGPALADDARWLATCFPGTAWLAAPLLLGPDDAARQACIAHAAAAAGIPVAATGAPLMHDASRRRLADVLTALRHRLTLDEAGYRLAANAERRLQPRPVLARRHPPDWLAETLAIAARCHFSPAELRYEYPREIVPPGATPISHLRALVDQGRTPPNPPGPDGVDRVPPRVRTQAEAELALIAELRYEAFFLTVEDIVRFARSQKILCQGRGSAANSVVCYALGMLSAIRRSLKLIGQWLGRPFGMPDIPREERAVYDMLCQADAMGVFQVESRAQMSMLPRLRPRCYYDLVVEVAIVRPGPIQGGMVHPYLTAREKVARHQPILYPRPEIEPVLKRTHGVPIFQEQVMQLAMVAAGFTAGEADQLRRAMGAWGRKGDLLRYQDKLTAGMLARGYRQEFADALCRQIQGFGSYGFPESHAASFALLVYVSAWIKRFHPAAFLCGLLNSQPMGFYGPSQLIQDARRHNVEVRPVDVQASHWECTLEPTTANPAQPAARLGLQLVKGLGAEPAARIVAARAAGPFGSVDELARRARLITAELRILASAGALASLAGHRRQAWWAAAGSQAAPGVLHDAPIPDTPPALAPPTEPQDIVADYARLGFTLGRHPLSFLRGMLCAERFLSAAEIAGCPDRKLARCAGIVTCRQRPGTAKGTLFVTLEDETGWVNVIVRPELLEAERRILLGASLIGIYGQIARQGDIVHLHAKRVVDRSAARPALHPQPRLPLSDTGHNPGDINLSTRRSRCLQFRLPASTRARGAPAPTDT